MGMFDTIRYNGHEYQTKDTPNQMLDQYEIRDDGTLWVEEYDAEWVNENDGFLNGYLEKKNIRWRFCEEFEGVIRFYRPTGKNQFDRDKWIEYSALFMDGKAIRIRRINE